MFVFGKIDVQHFKGFRVCALYISPNSVTSFVVLCEIQLPYKAFRVCLFNGVRIITNAQAFDQEITVSCGYVFY